MEPVEGNDCAIKTIQFVSRLKPNERHLRIQIPLWPPDEPSGKKLARRAPMTRREQLEAMNSHGARIQQLLEQIEALPTPSTRELIHEFMEATLAFYGQGLARILQVASESGPGRPERLSASDQRQGRARTLAYSRSASRRISRLVCARPWIRSVRIFRVTAAMWN